MRVRKAVLLQPLQVHPVEELKALVPSVTPAAGGHRAAGRDRVALQLRQPHGAQELQGHVPAASMADEAPEARGIGHHVCA